MPRVCICAVNRSVIYLPVPAWVTDVSSFCSLRKVVLCKRYMFFKTSRNWETWQCRISMLALPILCEVSMSYSTPDAAVRVVRWLQGPLTPNALGGLMRCKSVEKNGATHTGRSTVALTASLPRRVRSETYAIFQSRLAAHEDGKRLLMHVTCLHILASFAVVFTDDDELQSAFRSFSWNEWIDMN